MRSLFQPIDIQKGECYTAAHCESEDIRVILPGAGFEHHLRSISRIPISLLEIVKGSYEALFSLLVLAGRGNAPGISGRMCKLAVRA